jgi:hypothetical protein
MRKPSVVSGVEVVEETARLVKQMRFSANRPAYTEGEHVAVCVDPRWSDDNQTIEVLITCYALAHQHVDWEGLRINIELKEGERSVTWFSFLNQRGQAVRNELPVGAEYSLSLPYRVKSQIAERVLSRPPRQIRSRGDMQWAYEVENIPDQSPGVDAEELSETVVREGQSAEGSIRWSVEETGEGTVQVCFEVQEEPGGHLIAFSLVESTSGRVQYSDIVTLVPSRTSGKWEGRISLDSSVEVKPPCDLVFELLPPLKPEST